jgi:hypothetical protein
MRRFYSFTATLCVTLFATSLLTAEEMIQAHFLCTFNPLARRIDLAKPGPRRQLRWRSHLPRLPSR